MTAATFEYARPGTLAEALALLAGRDAVALAGGQSLVPLLVERGLTPDLVVDIGRIPALREIEASDHGLRIGAMARLRDAGVAATSAGLTLLADAVASVGSPAIRNRGTLAGNLVRASPNSELPVAAVALQARLLLKRRDGARELEAEAFFLGPHRTALAADEIVSAVIFPRQRAARSASAFLEIGIRSGAPPLVCVACVLELDAFQTITDARLVVGGITGVPARCPAAEAALVGQHAADAPARLAGTRESLVPSPQLPEAEYGLEVLPVLLKRALAAAMLQTGASP